MADNSLTIHTNQFFALVFKSPIQIGWLSIINSVTNISRLGTFNAFMVHLHHFSTVGIEVFLIFFLLIVGSGSVPLTNGSGSATLIITVWIGSYYS
jgi:hypothetical protein